MEEKREITIADLLIKLKDAWDYLLPKWKIITLFVLLGVSIGIYKSLNSKPIYKAKLRFLLQESNKSTSSSLLSAIGFSSGGENLYSTVNIIEILKSKDLVKEALLNPVYDNPKKTYAQLYVETKGWNIDNPKIAKNKFKTGLKLNELTRVQDSVINKIHELFLKQEYLVSQPNDKNGVIEIELISMNEKFSKYFLDEILEVISVNYHKMKVENIQKTVDLLKFQVDSVRNELNRSMYASASTSDDIFGLNPSKSVMRIPSTKAQTDNRINALTLEELVKNYEAQKLTLLKENPLIETIETPSFPLEMDKLGLLKGIVLGGFLAGLLVVLYFLFRRYTKNVFQNK